jgi:hypothetical protein
LVPIEPKRFGRRCFIYQPDTGRMSMMIEGAISVRLRKMAWSLALACLSSFGAAVTAQAEQFSAAIVTQHDDVSAPAGRLSVLDGRVRIETIEHPDGFFLIDTGKPSAYFVRPGAHVFMDARQSSQLTRLFVPVDPDAPCSQWQAMASLAGVAGQGEWRCERTGEETIDGRSTVVFRASFGAGQDYVGWIDLERRFPLRIRTEDGAIIALEQIRNEPQPESAFELPGNLQKFSPEALIDRIKQSDVWVPKPKN